jgi:ABC-type transport system involved in multi-copper enzyme maturation permease subunit
MFAALFRWSLWDAMRPRKVGMMVLLALVGPFFALMLQLGDIGAAAGYSLVVQSAVYQFSLVLLAIVFGCAVVAGEVTGRTIPYLLTRPVPRASIFIAKWLVAIIVCAVPVMISAVLVATVFGLNDVGSDRVIRDLWVLPIGAVVYCSAFACLSALLTRPVLVAVFYAFALESWIWAIPGDFPKLSLMAYLRALSQHSPEAGAPSGIMELLATLTPATISPTVAWNTLAVVMIGSIIVGSLVFSRGEYVPKEETN